MTDSDYSHRRLAGQCPMCGSQSLYLDDHGHVTCPRLDCPRPTAVDELLADRETHHIVQFREDRTFVIRHPLRERLGDELFTCDLHAYIASSPGRGSSHVRYRVLRDLDTGGWVWEVMQ